jgi:hypothetical protein
MPITNVVAKNADAEKLWKYILAYRSHMGNTSSGSKQERPLEDNVPMRVIPLEETVVVRAENSKE